MLNEEDPIDPEVLPADSGNNSLELVTRAEINQQIATAHAYPRNPAKAKSGMLTIATMDEETAGACFYSLPRGGKSIQGPSIRMAEIAASQWGNLRVQTRIIATVVDGPAPHVVIEGVSHDLESNLAVSVQKTRRITGKKANKGVPDADDIALAINACSAIAYRDSVFKVVPFAVVKPIVDRCRQIVAGDSMTIAARRSKCFEAFSKMGVTQKMILDSFGYRTIEEITADDLSDLHGRSTAIREEGAVIEELFAPKVAEQAPGAEPAPAPAPAAAPKPVSRRTRADAPTATPKPAPAQAPEQQPASTPEPDPAHQSPGDPVDDGAGETVPEEPPKTTATQRAVNAGTPVGAGGTVISTPTQVVDASKMPSDGPPSDEGAGSAETPQIRVAGLMTSWGYSFTEMRACLHNTGWWKSTRVDLWQGFSSIPDQIAEQIFRSQKHVKGQLAVFVGRPAKS